MSRPVAAVLAAHAAALADALYHWDKRRAWWHSPDRGASPNIAANEAVALMDAMLTELHRAREQLISQKRAYNAELDANLDEVLNRRPEE